MTEPTQVLDCDLLVAGGGPAGVACALSAARLGVRVILCQDRPVLGGNASSEVRMHMVGATGLKGGAALETELREGGIIEEIRLEQSVHNPQRSAAMLDLALYDKCRREPNLRVLLNTTVDGAEVSDGVVRSVLATRASTEDRIRITAGIFVDCTGDGRLGLEARAPFRHGRESREEFGESLAVERADRRTLGSSILFQARRHDRPMPFIAPPWVRRFRPEHFTLRPFGRSGSDLGLEYGYWWVEWGGCLDTIKDNERIRDELLAIALGVWNHVKNESGLDASNWALEWIGFLPGKRESRRFTGLHVLTEADLFESRPFPDAIAYGGWPIDTHPPEGIDAPDLAPCEQHHLPFLYDIPLRACISEGPCNLMFAGRNISATHIAFASTRVMATCAVVGQGVGTAAAFAIRSGLTPAALSGRPDLVREVQQRLLRDDCYLIGIRNEDELDLVRAAASITASSEQMGAEAHQVRSGQTRAVHGREREIPSARSENLWNSVLEGTQGSNVVTQAPPGRSFPGTHRWMSESGCGLPAWLEIRWESVVLIQEIQLVFDTGQHRHLTLSQADGYTAAMQWGRPQAETVRDYRIECDDGASWRCLVVVDGNYLRRRVHLLPTPVPAVALRIVVVSTNGIDHARIMEVRAYAAGTGRDV
ncbi:MAG: FAD-dependent oxidoreductase [Opitutaceae bacterium]|nr:FAD-dependent oxidoreductase [Opitutaceae bacterium]